MKTIYLVEKVNTRTKEIITIVSAFTDVQKAKDNCDNFNNTMHKGKYIIEKTILA